MSETTRTQRPRGSVRPAPLLVGTAAVAVVAAVAAVTFNAGTAAAQTGSATGPGHHTQVLHFGVDFSPPNLVHVPRVPPQPGDYQAGDYVKFNDVLRNGQGKAVGTEAGSGVITRIDASSVEVVYSMAVQLPGGQLAAQGISSNAPTKHLAITGGTGQYVGAAGDLELIENGDGTGRLTLTLR